MLEHTMQLYGRASMETVRLNKSGALIDVSVLVAPIELSGVTVGNFVSYRDISDKKQTDAKLQHDALHDALTGLANRTLFFDRLQLTMADSSAAQRWILPSSSSIWIALRRSMTILAMPVETNCWYVCPSGCAPFGWKRQWRVLAEMNSPF